MSNGGEKTLGAAVEAIAPYTLNKWSIQLSWQVAALIGACIYVLGTVGGLVFPNWMPWETKNDHVHDISAVNLKFDDEIALMNARLDTSSHNEDLVISTNRDLQKAIDSLNMQISELQGRIDEMNNPQHFKVK